MTDELLALWRRFRASRESDIRDTLICHYIGLLRKVAGRLSLRLPPHVDLDDLEAAGVPGLLAAVETYDPEKDVEFTAYAQLRIRGAILDELRSLDPLPRSIREKARHIERAVATLEQKLLRSPSDAEVAKYLLVPLEAYHQVLYEIRGGLHVSLDSGWGTGLEEDGEGIAPALPEGRALNPWQVLSLKERQRILGATIEELPRSERIVLSLYYYEELTMREIGAVLEVSESRVSQIHGAALRRIRARLHRRRLRPEDLHVEDRVDHNRLGMARAIP